MPRALLQLQGDSCAPLGAQLPAQEWRKLSELLANARNALAEAEVAAVELGRGDDVLGVDAGGGEKGRGGPLPGRPVTARRTSGVLAAASARTPATVSPMPPSAQWSSTVMSALVSPAAAKIASASTGLTE